MKRDFLTLDDVTRPELEALLQSSARLKDDLKRGVPHRFLEGQTLGMIFKKPSSRTRVSFEIGMFQLGGLALFLNNHDLGMGVRESVADIGRLFSRYLDGIVIRTFAHEEVEELARYATIPVINGLTDLHHPCQILADLLTVQEKFGRCEGMKLAWVGDGNNVANSWLQGAAKMGMHLSLGLSKGVLAASGTHPQDSGGGRCPWRQRRARGGSHFKPSKGRISSIPMCGSAWDRKQSDAGAWRCFSHTR